MNLFFVSAFVAITSTAAFELVKNDTSTALEPSCVRVVDGDTDVLQGCSNETNKHIRALGYDTPEMSGKSRCQNEIDIAKRATARRRELHDAGGVHFIPTGRKDRYGRYLGQMWTKDGVPFGDILIAEGLALPWKPGKAHKQWRKAQWCGEGG
ncbi:MAG: thermonuclease family protein [Phycisphaerales bacterium]|nr:thermonuclease family protein [Phycisphaerales bacterium]